MRTGGYTGIPRYGDTQRDRPSSGSGSDAPPRTPSECCCKPIHIVVEDSHLTLEGELEQQREKRVAEEQGPYAVQGVRSVTNNIVVTGTDTEELQPIDFEKDPWWRDSRVGRRASLAG